jgi:hypothetical protein
MTAPRRTIVGSHPHRRTLPMGREAIERARAMCERWGCETVESSCARAMRTARPRAMRCSWVPMFAAWLPPAVTTEFVPGLEAMLESEARP